MMAPSARHLGNCMSDGDFPVKSRNIIKSAFGENARKRVIGNNYRAAGW
jgi:hypothetical protein